MNLRIVILEAKALSKGGHKIRIAISHNCNTRYILTRFTIPSAKNLKNGAVVGVPDASYINQQLRSQMNEIYKIYDEKKQTVDYLTCSQFIELIKQEQGKGNKGTFSVIAEEWLELRKKVCKPRSVEMYKKSIGLFQEFSGDNYLIARLNNRMVYDYKSWLKDTKKYSSTTQRIYIGIMRAIVNYAIKHNYCKYEISPFIDFKMPQEQVRNSALTVQELRTIRNATINDPYMEKFRDIFMLSFYLCGMNPADMHLLDYTKPYVSFIRAKTKSRRKAGDVTEFTIQPEARMLLDKYCVDGKLPARMKSKRNPNRINYTYWTHKLKNLLNIDGPFMFYSARKTFAQIANELGIKDSIIEYCIGDAQSKRVLSFYVKVDRKMADRAIREVFDFVASDMTTDDWLDRKYRMTGGSFPNSPLSDRNIV